LFPARPARSLPATGNPAGGVNWYDRTPVLIRSATTGFWIDNNVIHEDPESEMVEIVEEQEDNAEQIEVPQTFVCV
jgi:hypothetical protein